MTAYNCINCFHIIFESIDQVIKIYPDMQYHGTKFYEIGKELVKRVIRDLLLEDLQVNV